MRVIQDGQRWSKALRRSMKVKERWKFLKAHLPSSPTQMYRKSEQLIMGLLRKSGKIIRHSGELIRNSGSWMAEEEMFRDSERRSETKKLSLWNGLFCKLVSGLLSGFVFGFIIWIFIWVPVTETLGWKSIDWNPIVAQAEPVDEPVTCWHWKMIFVILTVLNTVVSFSALKEKFKAGVIANFWICYRVSSQFSQYNCINSMVENVSKCKCLLLVTSMKIGQNGLLITKLWR